MIEKSRSVDTELNSHLIKVYGYVAAGLFLSGICAYFLYSYIFSMVQYDPRHAVSILRTVELFGGIGALGIIIYISFQSIENISLSALNAMYWVFCILQGLGFASLMIYYTGESIFSVLFITSAMFISFSFYGYVTESNLSGIGSFLMLLIIGMLASLIINIFLGSSALMYVISIIGIVVFSALSAYNTQMIKRQYLYNYLYNRSEEYLAKSALWGAFSLYINFINLLQFMLYIFGNRR